MFKDSPPNESFYREVLEKCCLLPDLEQLVAGEFTEIGERGINLSGGQRARVSVARAVYRSDAEIIILDDPFSAVDAHVADAMFQNVLCGLLQSKTRVLVTNQLQFLHKVDYHGPKSLMFV